jgi:hypothetical protein
VAGDPLAGVIRFVRGATPGEAFRFAHPRYVARREARRTEMVARAGARTGTVREPAAGTAILRGEMRRGGTKGKDGLTGDWRETAGWFGGIWMVERSGVNGSPGGSPYQDGGSGRGTHRDGAGTGSRDGYPTGTKACYCGDQIRRAARDAPPGDRDGRGPQSQRQSGRRAGRSRSPSSVEGREGRFSWRSWALTKGGDGLSLKRTKLVRYGCHD